MPRPTHTWKNWERKVAKYLNGERTHWALHDARAGIFDIEIKHGKQIPKTLLKWWAQANTNCRDDRLPLLVLHPPQWKLEDCLAIIPLEILRGLFDDMD